MSPARKPTCFSGWEELLFSIGKLPKKSRKILKEVYTYLLKVYENNADLNAAINISRASINKPIVDNRKVKSQTQSL
jgi:hypothetical protein